MIEKAKGTRGFPNPNILENYHTQAEIVQIRRREAHEAIEKERKNATVAIEKLLGKKIANITTQERDDTARKLNLDVHDPRIPTPGGIPAKQARLTTGQVNAPATRGNPRAGRGGGRVGTGVPNLTRVDSPTGPAKNTRSRSPKKTAADDQPAGQGSSKKRAADNQPASQGSPKKKKTGKNVTIAEGVGKAI
jgi:hypothetical protein